MISWVDLGSIDSVHGAAYVSPSAANVCGDSGPLGGPASFKNQMSGVCN
jgi:hypothetical protein